MKHQIFALAAVLLLSTNVFAQNTFSPFQLSLFQIDDVRESTPDANPPAPETLDANAPVVATDVLAAENLPVISSSVAVPVTESAETEVERTVTQAEISRLNRPIGQIRLSGLVESTPALIGLDVSEVSQSGFMIGPARLISASGLDTSAFPKTVTPYSRQRLYFEDYALERLGKSDGCLRTGVWTNGRSAAKFLVDTALLPYRMIKGHPKELVGAVAE